jgi:hypothetical protein
VHESVRMRRTRHDDAALIRITGLVATFTEWFRGEDSELATHADLHVKVHVRIQPGT